MEFHLLFKIRNTFSFVWNNKKYSFSTFKGIASLPHNVHVQFTVPYLVCDKTDYCLGIKSLCKLPWSWIQWFCVHPGLLVNKASEWPSLTYRLWVKALCILYCHTCSVKCVRLCVFSLWSTVLFRSPVIWTVWWTYFVKGGPIYLLACVFSSERWCKYTCTVCDWMCCSFGIWPLKKKNPSKYRGIL